MDVIKRSGSRQRFSRAKLERAISRALREARISGTRAKEIVREISEGVYTSIIRRRSIRAADLRKRVIDRLERRARSAASAWRRYDRRKRR